MKIVGVKQLLQKKFKMVQNLPLEWQESLGNLEEVFVMIIWGSSGSGKSNFVYKFVKFLSEKYSTLYVALEEGHSLTTQNLINRHDLQSLSGKLKWANHETTYHTLVEYLKRKKSPRVIIIDSIQYFHITYQDYKNLKEMFPKKTFIFISHAKGKSPDGKTADKIRYDAGIKVFVDKYMAFVVSRYGGNKNYVVWEEGAKKKWGLKQFNKIKNK